MLRLDPNKPHRFHDGRRGAALNVRVVPKAARTDIAEIMEDGTLRIRVAAVPEKGKVNSALLEFLAKVLQVPQSNLEIVAGETQRDKIVVVMDLSPEEVEARLHAYLHRNTR